MWHELVLAAAAADLGARGPGSRLLDGVSGQSWLFVRAAPGGANLGWWDPATPGDKRVGSRSAMSLELTTRPRRGRRGGWILNAACVLVTLLALLFLLPAALGLSRYVVTGTSMSGTIERGSVVLEKTVPVADLRVGDIITYLPPAESGIDTVLTHRIVSIDGTTLRTQGDANRHVDPWVFQLTSTAQPRVVADIPWVGYLFIALADRSTRLLVVGLPVAVIALLSLRELAGGWRPRRPARPAREAAATAPAVPPVAGIPVPRAPVAPPAAAHPRH